MLENKNSCLYPTWWVHSLDLECFHGSKNVMPAFNLSSSSICSGSYILVFISFIKKPREDNFVLPVRTVATLIGDNLCCIDFERVMNGDVPSCFESKLLMLFWSDTLCHSFLISVLWYFPLNLTSLQIYGPAESKCWITRGRRNREMILRHVFFHCVGYQSLGG